MIENKMIVPDKIIRSERKTLSISVDTTGKLIVRAPLRCSEARILAFIEKKSDWILKRKQRAQATAALLPTENLDGFSFPYLNGNVQIQKYEGKRIFYEESFCALFIPQDGNIETVKRWLKRQGKSVFSAMTQRRAQEMGATYKSVSVSSAKGRWGSCSADNSIRLTYHLLHAPIAVVDYVIVHELAHTFHKNHGKAFWDKVAQHCPDWKTKRKWLKAHGYLMYIF